MTAPAAVAKAEDIDVPRLASSTSNSTGGLLSLSRLRLVAADWKSG